MSKLASVVLITLLAMLLVACGSKNTATESGAAQMDAGMASSADLGKVIEDTSASLKEAVTNGYAWRDTGKILDKAKKLSEEGKTEKAQQLAMKASEQIKMAQQQSEEQKNAGPWLF